MKGSVYRITGTFSPEIGFKLGSNLNGGVAYAYKRTSWDRLKKQLDLYNNPKKFFFLELEIQQSFHHIKKLIENGLKILIIEETDILLPEYEHGSFDNFVNEINEICSLGVNVYFNSTWKEEELSEAFKKIGLTVHKLTFKNEDIFLNENEKLFKEDVKEDVKQIKDEIKDEKIEIKEVVKGEKNETKQIKNSIEIIKVVKGEKNETKQIKSSKYQEENHKKNNNDLTDLELFYSKPKTIWQKLMKKIVYFLEKITNNF